MGDYTKSIEEVEQRSKRRVYDRLSDDAPCKGKGEVLCPFCDRPLRVRRTILGHLDEVDGRRPHIDGVQMKCAGDGCGFRPDFDVPISREEWEKEMEARDRKIVDMGYTPREGDDIVERLQSLGYIVE